MAYLIGTAGHVDHGKTTLIAALTGIDADRLPEEKSRGMTIDLGFAYIDLPDIGRVSIVDVPGHERFIKNMLAGASGVDVAMLCVAADEGVMPQTREHFEILRLLEAPSLVVALTKCDAADEESQALAEFDVRELLNETPYQDAEIIRVSAKTGFGLGTLKDAMRQLIMQMGPREVSNKWFLPIDRVFTVAGHGTVVTGTLASGKVGVGEEAELMPGAEKVRIRSIQAHAHPVEAAEAGQRTALNIAGVRKEALHRGQALGAPGVLFETRCINLRLAALRELKHGIRVRAHVGSGEFIGKLFLFDNAPGFAQLRFECDVACAQGQRIVLRRYSPAEVVAGGEIVTPNATPRRKNDEDVAEMFTKERGSLEERILAELQKKPFGEETGAICEALGQSPQTLGDAFEELKMSGAALSFAGIWVAGGHYEKLAQMVMKTLMDLHTESPSASAVPKSAVLSASKLRWDPKSFDRLIAKMAEDGLIVAHGAEIKHSEYQIALSGKQEALLARVIEAINRHGATLPASREIAEELGVPVQAVAEITRLGIEVGMFVKVEEGMYYPVETLEQIKKKLLTLPARFTVAQFRDATDSSRKYALPLLQYFDEKKITKRIGDVRILLSD